VYPVSDDRAEKSFDLCAMSASLTAPLLHAETVISGPGVPKCMNPGGHLFVGFNADRVLV
jgi:hypothetical protein